MRTTQRHQCLSGFELASYLSGALGIDEKQGIEYHLGACDSCFESFMGAFNDHLDRAVPFKRDGRSKGKNGGSTKASCYAASIFDGR